MIGIKDLDANIYRNEDKFSPHPKPSDWDKCLHVGGLLWSNTSCLNIVYENTSTECPHCEKPIERMGYMQYLLALQFGLNIRELMEKE